MQRIHKALRNWESPNCRKLAEEIEVSPKTIQRDIAFMRDQLGLPIEYDPSAYGYYYAGEVADFPSLQVTEGEVLALFVAQKALAQYRGTPFEKPLAKAFRKLAAGMLDEISFSLGALDRDISFSHTGRADPHLAIFQQVARALRESREITFDYHKLTAAGPERRTVRPYHLGCIDDQWYLFAFDMKRKAVRTFVIGRIIEVRSLGKSFRKPEDFSIAERLARTFGVFKGSGDYIVEIRFDPFASRLVKERTWQPGQVVKERGDGTVDLILHLDSLEEIERWVLSWGNHASVISPKELRDRVKNTARTLSNRYSPMPTWFAELKEMADRLQSHRLTEWMLNLERAPEDPNQLHLQFAGPEA